MRLPTTRLISRRTPLSRRQSYRFRSSRSWRERGSVAGGYENWWGLFAPRGTPPEIVNQLNAGVNKVLVSPQMKDFLDREGAEAAVMTVSQLADLLPKEIARYRKAAQAAGLEPQ